MANKYCNCAGDHCSCCATLASAHIIHFNDTFCGELEFQPSTQVIQLEVTLNGKDVYDYSFDLGQYERECFAVPYTAGILDVCVDFSHTILNATYVGSCLGLEADVKSIPLANATLGCFGFHY